MTTQILDSEIVYDRTTKDYAILIAGVAVGFAPTYSQAEQVRTQALAERRDEGLYATATELEPDPAPPVDDGPDDNWGGFRAAEPGQDAPYPPQEVDGIPDPDPSPGRAIARAWHRDYRGFARRQSQLDEHDLLRDASAYAAYMSARLPKQPPLTAEHVVMVWRLAARYAI